MNTLDINQKPHPLLTLTYHYESIFQIVCYTNDDEESLNILTLSGASALIDLFYTQGKMDFLYKENIVQNIRIGTEKDVQKILKQHGLNWHVEHKVDSDAWKLKQLAVISRVIDTPKVQSDIISAYLLSNSNTIIKEGSPGDIFLSLVKPKIDADKFLISTPYDKQAMLSEVVTDVMFGLEDDLGDTLNDFVEFGNTYIYD